jgi:hypothetical protein
MISIYRVGNGDYIGIVQYKNDKWAFTLNPSVLKLNHPEEKTITFDVSQREYVEYSGTNNYRFSIQSNIFSCLPTPSTKWRFIEASSVAQ